MMKEQNNIDNRKYIKICKESGCVSANYDMEKLDEEMTVITYEGNDLSGNFKYSKAKRKN